MVARQQGEHNVSTIVMFAVFSLIVAGGVYAWLLLRVGPAPDQEDFQGHLYRVGFSQVYYRPGNGSDETVVAVHGFLESPVYFTSLYRDDPADLVLVANGDYHSALRARRTSTPSWAEEPTPEIGTIEYDAEILIQAVEHLVTTSRIVLHGHSRGGAVVLEAAARRPNLFANASAILEAPVLPGAYQRRPLPRVVIWALPLLLPLWRRQPINRYNRPVWGALEDPRKRALIRALPCNVRRALTVRRNLLNLAAWVQSREPEMCQRLAEMVVLVPERDRVLDPGTMAASAERGGDGVRVVRLPDLSHFVTLDCPQALARTNLLSCRKLGKVSISPKDERAARA